MIPTELMAEVLDRFALTVVGEYRTEDVLRELAECAIRVLDVDAAGVMAASGDDALLRWVFATTDVGAEIGQLQEDLQDGPCALARTTGRVVAVTDLSADGRWPQFRQQAVELGLRAVTAIPLVARGRVWGVLDLYRRAPVGLDDAEQGAATRLAALATSYLVVTEDRDTARRAKRELAHRAMHDLVTGLPVRWVFLEQLDRALARLQRHPGTVAVLFLDVDGLKYVNDTYGHTAGDRLLQACAERARAVLRPSDVLARLGGDEFVVLLEELTGPDAAAGVAQRMVEEVNAAVGPGDGLLRPSVSIGVATTSDPGLAGETLISQADAAMYRAKRNGRGQFQPFDPGSYAADKAATAARQELTAQLRSALVTGQLELAYQPVLDLTGVTEPQDVAAEGLPAGARLWAVEALVRWRHPTRGLLVAGDFIDDAERNGLIVELGAWVMAQACRQLAAWDRGPAAHAPPRVLVNVSATELAHGKLAQTVAASLGEHGLTADRLALEVTESGLLSPAADQAVAGLRELGCQIAVDDFGTGYSSLSRLVDLPTQILKVDRSFVRNLTQCPASRAVVAAILRLGQDLAHTVVVEGVEDQPTLEALLDLGATHVQGFHLARPLSGDAVTALATACLV